MSRYDKLVKSDPDYKLKKHFNVDLIADNVKNLKDTFMLFKGKISLQRKFIHFCFEPKTKEESDDFLSYIFSTNSSNKFVLNKIKDWAKKEIVDYDTRTTV